MKIFNIYHAVGPDKFTANPDQIRLYAGHVQAETLEQAFYLSQNLDFVSWNSLNPCRSTSVGDMIETDNRWFLVSDTGFIEQFYEDEEPREDMVLYANDLYDYSAE